MSIMFISGFLVTRREYIDHVTAVVPPARRVRPWAKMSKYDWGSEKNGIILSKKFNKKIRRDHWLEANCDNARLKWKFSTRRKNAIAEGLTITTPRIKRVRRSSLRW